MSVKPLLGAALFTLCLSACSEQSTVSTTEKQAEKNTVKEPVNKFKTTAIKKIQHITAGISETQATCVIEDMLADGQVGLGEINQMAADQGHVENTSSVVQKAYKAALAECISG